MMQSAIDNLKKNGHERRFRKRFAIAFVAMTNDILMVVAMAQGILSSLFLQLVNWKLVTLMILPLSLKKNILIFDLSLEATGLSPCNNHYLGRNTQMH